ARSSTAALTSGNPPSRSTDAQPVRPNSRSITTPILCADILNPRIHQLVNSELMTDPPLFQLFDLGDRPFLNIDRETNPVPRLQPLEKRRRIDAIAHRHRFHEIFDLSVLQDDLARLRYRRDDLSFADDRLRGSPFNLTCLMLTMLGCHHGRHRLD